MEQVIAPKPLHSPKSEAETPWSNRRRGNRLPAPCSPTGDHKQGWFPSPFSLPQPQSSNQPGLYPPSILWFPGVRKSWALKSS